MAELLLTNLDDSTVRRLQENAAQHGISVEEEVKHIIHTSFQSQREQAIAWIREFKKRNPVPQKTDSVDLLREDRDR